MADKMQMITCFLTKKDIKRLDKCVSEGEYPNRSEMIRTIIKMYLEKNKVELDDTK